MMIGLLQKLAGYQGEVMRIKNFKVAYGYIGHLKIFLFIWFSLLPLALVETSGWLTILWTPISTFPAPDACFQTIFWSWYMHLLG